MCGALKTNSTHTQAKFCPGGRLHGPVPGPLHLLAGRPGGDRGFLVGGEVTEEEEGEERQNGPELLGSKMGPKIDRAGGCCHARRLPHTWLVRGEVFCQDGRA